MSNDQSSDFLYKQRIKLGLTLVDLSARLEAAGVPTSPSSISRIERSLTFPHPARLSAYCSIIGITAEQMPDIRAVEKSTT